MRPSVRFSAKGRRPEGAAQFGVAVFVLTIAPQRFNTGGTMASQAAMAGPSSTAGIWKVISASSVGTMIEWYDFYIFGSLAAVLSPIFYPPGNDTFALF